jgi:hypothetical protein
MFKSLVEEIRTEAMQRGSLRAAFQRTPGASKEVKRGAARYLRQQSKKELKTKAPDDVNIPRRGIKGYAD